MALPTNRKEFATYCLRKLGAPVIKIDVDQDQVEDRIDEGILFFSDYHFDGSDKIYYKYQLTQTDIDNKYIPLPDNIIGVVDIFDLGESTGTNNLFNLRYQIALNDVYTLSSPTVSLTPYYMALTNVQFLEQILVGKQPFRYNRHVNRLYIDTNWSSMQVGQYVIVIAYTVIDPNQFNKLWSDRWLARYVTCLIKENWGNNLKKYSGMKMPGGTLFSGQQIYEEAIKEKEALEKDMVFSYSLPASDQIG